jgi:NAD/NADP transhydrogenase beta subunit
MRTVTKRFPLFVFLMAVVFAPAFTPTDIKTTINEINAAIKSGDVSKIIGYLSDPVDLTLPSADDSYSKAQAGMILKKFFSQNKVKSYVSKRTGKSVDGSMFTIGSYTAQNGKVFRSYILIKSSGGKNLIQFIEFEEE